MTKILGCAILLLATVVAMADASNCPVRVRTVATVVHAPPVVAAVYATPIVYAQVPAYSASYSTPGVDQGTLQALVQQLQALRAEVAALKQGNGNGGGVEPFKGQQGPPPMPGAVEKGAAPQGGIHPGLSILQARCASCHGGTAAKGQAPSFNPAKLTAEQAVGILVACYRNTMPKTGPKLTDEENGQVVDYIGSLKSK